MESKRSLILQWIEQEVLNKNQVSNILSAIGVLPDGLRWRIFLANLTAWLGGLALIFSMMFFIAYNWDAMGRFAKFALVEFSIALCMVAYWKIDKNKITAKISITMASILLGVLLALYGQTYQTGADPWQLFFYWALLMLPWALVAQFVSMWLLWVLLLNLSLMLYFNASGFLFGLFFNSIQDIFWLLFLFNLIIWVVWEFAATKFQWLSERWAIRLVAITSSYSISFLIIMAIFDQFASEQQAIFLYITWAVAIYFTYRKISPDLFMLAGLCLSVIVVITSFFVNILFKGNDPIAGFFILSLLVIGMAAAAAKWLKSVQKDMLV